MCGRYALSSSVELLIELFGLAEAVPLAPRYNIAPTQDAPVVRAVGPTGARTALVRRLDLLHWGLIPSWSRDPTRPGARAQLINARVETATEKRSFREALRERRCLVPIDGFYEWREDDRGGKHPYFIRARSGKPLALAGLWDRWRGTLGAQVAFQRAGPTGDATMRGRTEAPEGETVVHRSVAVPAGETTPQRSAHQRETVIESFTVLTTPPNALVAPLHDRMPAIIAPEDFERWLDPALRDPLAILAMVRQAPDDLLVSYAVSRYVNNAVNEGPECVEPTTEEGAGDEREVVEGEAREKRAREEKASQEEATRRGTRNRAEERQGRLF